VLEWLNGRPGFTESRRVRVVGAAAWIVNTDRSHLYANGDCAPITDAKVRSRASDHDFAADLPPYWGETRADAPTGAGRSNT